MVKIYYNEDANLELLAGKTVAIIGYGSQGHAHALNLQESGVNVVVGLYEGSKSWAKAEAAGLKVMVAAEAAKVADVVMILIPDEKQAATYYKDIEPNLEPGNALAFAHGFNIHFNQIVPPAGIDVFMVAPKGPGHLVRRTYTEGSGVPCLVTAYQDATGKAFDLALAYAKGIGGTRAGALTTTFRRENGTFDYGKVMSENALVTDKNDPRYNADSYTGSQLIIAENRNYHNWVGLVSTYSTNFKDCIDFYAGVDVRYYNGIHQAVISDLMGGEYFIDATRTTSVDPKLNYHANDVNWRNEKLGVGDVVYRDYEGRVLQEGVFAQAEYNKGDWAAFLSGSLSCTSYKRIDHFYYDENNNESALVSFAGGTIKTGFNYNINNWNNVFVNVGYISRAPKFSYGAFMSSNTSNVLNINAKNEQVASAEIGYGFHNEIINVMVNGYFTEWMDKAMTKTGTTDQQEDYFMNMTGVNARHMGVEVEFKARPTKWLELSAMFSWGDWTWDSDSVKGYMFDEKGTPLAFNEKQNGVTSTPASAIGAEDHAWAMVNMKGIHVGGSAQTTANVGIMFKPFKGFRIGGEYTLQARNYSYYSFSGSNLNVGKSMSVIEPLILPVGGALDLRASYHFEIGKCNATISGNINNLLDQYYIEKAWNPSSISSTGGEANMDNIHFFYSYGRTFNLRLKLAF